MRTDFCSSFFEMTILFFLIYGSNPNLERVIEELQLKISKFSRFDLKIDWEDMDL